MRYLIRFSYDGTKFHGFQRQNKARNVQSELEKVLSDYFKEEIIVKGSGRTDAGVHAKDQCAHFDISKKISNKDIVNLNDKFNKDIVINKKKLVDDSFHARYHVKEKTYIYKINNGKYKSELDGYYYQIGYKLDYKKMKEAASLLVGTHDYHNFVSGVREDYYSTIYKIKIKKKNDMYILKFKGIGFYRYMVRHLVGAIVDIGRGKERVETIKSMLEHPDIHKNLSVVPASGLYLEKIKY